MAPANSQRSSSSGVISKPALVISVAPSSDNFRLAISYFALGPYNIGYLFGFSMSICVALKNDTKVRYIWPDKGQLPSAQLLFCVT
jgi:hypothetical protein